MPYLRCPRCHRTAWLGAEAEPAAECRQCGAKPGRTAESEARFLTAAVRERLAAEARRSSRPPRFVRDAGPRRAA